MKPTIMETIVDEKMQKAEKMLRAAFEKHGIMDIDVDYGQMYHAVIVDALLKDGWQFTARVETGVSGDEKTDLDDEMVGFVIRHDCIEIYEGVDRLADFGENVDKFFDGLTTDGDILKKHVEYTYGGEVPKPPTNYLFHWEEGKRTRWFETLDEGTLLDLREGLLDLLYDIKDNHPENRIANAIYSVSIYITEGSIDKKILIENNNDLCVLLKVIEDYESR